MVWRQNISAAENHWAIWVKPPTAGRLLWFFQKNYKFNAIQIKYRSFLEPFERTTLQEFLSQLKK